MLNNNGPRYKRSKLERQMNVDVFWCVIILLVMCLFTAIGMWGADYKLAQLAMKNGLLLGPVKHKHFSYFVLVYCTCE